MKNASVESVLSILSDEAKANLRAHFITQHVKSVMENLNGKKEEKPKTEKKPAVVIAATEKKTTAKTAAKPSIKAKENPVATETTKKNNKGLSEFVRTQPIDIPADDVVEAAKSAGLELSTSYIYNIRCKMRKDAATTAK